MEIEMHYGNSWIIEHENEQLKKEITDLKDEVESLKNAKEFPISPETLKKLPRLLRELGFWPEKIVKKDE